MENAVGPNALRPGEVIATRKGVSVEIDNTDAEGRLVLCDALVRAGEDAPELILDFATLTGAARIALGPDLPALYANDDALANDWLAAGQRAHDPLWRMPLYKGYEKDVTARIADLTNAPAGGMAGSITAALFLKRFVTNAKSWAHFDIFGWAPTERPHSPLGGEAQAIRALYHLIAAAKK